MDAILAIVVIAGTATILTWHYLVAIRRQDDFAKRSAPIAHLGGAERLALGLTAFGALIGAVTALPGMTADSGLRSWWLVAHMWSSPLLVLGLAGWALLAARRFLRVSRMRAGGGGWAGWCSAWLALGAGAACIASIFFSMMRWFGQEGQDDLLRVHRYTALALLIGLMWHLYLARVRKG